MLLQSLLFQTATPCQFTALHALNCAGLAQQHLGRRGLLQAMPMMNPPIFLSEGFSSAPQSYGAPRNYPAAGRQASPPPKKSGNSLTWSSAIVSQACAVCIVAAIVHEMIKVLPHYSI
jgi:hypothetical protein